MHRVRKYIGRCQGPGAEVGGEGMESYCFMGTELPFKKVTDWGDG